MYPLRAEAIAMAAPVLPLVAATTVMPGLSCPEDSACAMMCCAILSLIEPEGFRYSHFAMIFTFGLSEYWDKSRSGVPPMS